MNLGRFAKRWSPSSRHIPTTSLLVATLLLQQQQFQVHSMMTWAATWDNILSGGPTRWKVDDLAVKQQALHHLLAQHGDSNSESLKILCPLAGDDPFVQLAWSAGHDVTAIGQRV